MKLRELVKITGVSRETIQYYLREGILPKPRKRDRNQAEYDESYVDLIKLIKDLQDNHFLPLAIIKKILKQKKKVSPDQENYLRIQSEFFSPVEEFLSRDVVGEEAFREATGMSPKWRRTAEEWGVITPEIIDSEKVYSFEDVSIGKLMVEMDKSGFGPRDGFDPEALKHFGDLLEGLFERFTHKFTTMYSGKLTPEEFSEMSNRGLDLMGIYFYLRYRKMAKKRTEAHLSLLQEKFEAALAAQK